MNRKLMVLGLSCGLVYSTLFYGGCGGDKKNPVTTNTNTTTTSTTPTTPTNTFNGPMVLEQSDLYKAKDNGKLAQVYDLIGKSDKYNNVIKPQWMNKSYDDGEAWVLKLTKDEGNKYNDGIQGNGTLELVIAKNENSDTFSVIEDLDAGIPDKIYEMLKDI